MKEWNRRLLCWALVAPFVFCAVWAIVTKADVGLTGAVLGALGAPMAVIVERYFKRKSEEKIAEIKT